MKREGQQARERSKRGLKMGGVLLFLATLWLPDKIKTAKNQ